MYEARDRRELEWQAELAVDAYRSAVRLAEELGLDNEAARLTDRLLHVKAVARQLR